MDEDNQRLLAELQEQNAKLQQQMAALQRSHQLLQAVVEGTTDAVFVKDLRGRYLMANTAAMNFAGKSAEEILGNDDTHFFSTETARQIMERDRRIMESGQTQTDEEIGTAAGQTRTYLSTKGPFRDELGRVIGLIGISRDVTERKRLEQQLAERERRLRTILDSEPECVKTLAADGTVLEMNRAGLAMVEADSPDQVLGQCVYSVVVSEDQSAYRSLVERVFQGYSETLEFEVIGLKGHRRWLETHGTPLRDESGQIISLLSVTRDVTERKTAEQMLAASEERFSKAFRNSPDAMSLIGLPEGRVIDVNDRFIELSGHRREDVIGRTTLELGFWDDPAQRDSFYQMLREQGAVSGLDATVLTKSGELCEVQLSSVLFELDGRSCMMTSSRDVSAQRRAERALYASEQRFRALIEHSFDAIALVGQDGKLLYSSPAATRITGRSADEWTGQSAFDRIHPDDVQHARDFFAKLLENPALPQQSQIRYLHKDESWIWLEVTATNLLKQPAVQAIVVNYRDITARKRVEESLSNALEFNRQIIECAAEGFAVYDRELRYVVWNPFMERLSGVPAADVIGRRPEEVFPFLRETGVVANLERALAGETLGTPDMPFSVPQSGRSGWSSAHHTPLRDVTGEIIGVISTIRDITERKQDEETLRESERRHRELLEGLPVAVYLTDAEGRLTMVNEAAVAFWGRRPILGEEKWCGSLRLYTADGKFLPHAECPMAVALRQGQAIWGVEAQAERPDGTRVIFMANITPLFDRSGKGIGAMNVLMDITERKQAEEKSQLFGRILDDSLNEIYIFDAASLLFVRVNSGAQRNLGYTMEELISRLTPLDLKPEFNLESFEALVEPLRAGRQERIVFETIHRRKDGSTYPTDVHLQLANADEPPLFVAIIQDITERKQAEMALRESRMFLEKAQHLAHLGTWVSGLAPNDRLWWSDQTYEIFGIAPEQFDGRVENFFAMVHPDDRLAVQTASRLALSGERPYNLEHRILRPDGAVRWVHELADVVRNTDGRVIQMIGVVQDITERRQAEESLRASEAMLELILDSIPQGVFWKDRNSVYLGANRVSRRAIGFDTAESIVGKTDFDVSSLSREQAEFYVHTDRKVMNSDRPQFNIKETMTLTDGSTIWLETNKMPMHDAAGNVTGILGTWQDITERKRADDELRASRERLVALSRQLIETQENERRHLARELHDEIGQALTGIKLNLRALQQPSRASALGPLVQETIAVVDQALQQVRDMALDLRPSMLDEIGLVAALRWCFDQQARRAGFAAHFLAEPAECSASKDIETACFRVAQESLTNIARHANARNVHLEVRQHDSELELLIQDDGIGFDVSAARDRAMTGASLGLLGMQERVQLTGGQLEIQSMPSGGTTIRARFPWHGSSRVTEESA